MAIVAVATVALGYLSLDRFTVSRRSAAASGPISDNDRAPRSAAGADPAI
jgi:hypothetical protein